MSQADKYLKEVYTKLGIDTIGPEEKYNNLDRINFELDLINASLAKPMNVQTTGTINERLVQLALEGYMPKSWYRLTHKKYQWLGDFGVMGYPLSTIISVKSFKTKERLLVSGTGSLHAPTIGWGRFDDPKEFSEERLKAYLFRGFLAIYMPSKTISELLPEAQNLNNHYGKKLIRSINDFGNDLKSSLISEKTSSTILLNTSGF